LKLLKKALGVMVVIAIVIGAKFWHKSSSYNEAKAQMLEFCKGISKCKAVFTRNFNACFHSHYDMGSRKLSSGLNHEAFRQCINYMGSRELLVLNH
jgi:hypothetical protein